MTRRQTDHEPAWSREQIRMARRKQLAPLVQKLGLELRDRGGGNMELSQYPGLVIKNSYWIWPEKELSGNTIDFFVKVPGMSFNDTMKHISAE
ncbi:MAG: hypothetical protein KAG97_10170 [Victivallales bacterium]|nr:hypothetical protein [Victivallales bacterium]